MSPMPKANQTSEQAVRDNIDGKLSQAGWCVQDKNKINFTAGLGIAVILARIDENIRALGHD